MGIIIEQGSTFSERCSGQAAGWSVERNRVEPSNQKSNKVGPLMFNHLYSVSFTAFINIQLLQPCVPRGT